MENGLNVRMGLVFHGPHRGTRFLAAPCAEGDLTVRVVSLETDTAGMKNPRSMCHDGATSLFLRFVRSKLCELSVKGVG